MHIKNIPADINVELLLAYLPEGSFRVAMRGLHKRNSYNDIVDTDEQADGAMLIGVSRKSLYNVLPEYMFHPADRFSNLPRLEEKERFAEEYEEQEREKEQAYRFFNPVDLLLLKLRADTREALRPYTEHDSVMAGIIADRLTPEQRANRFVRQALPFMPSCRRIRGDRTLLTLLMRKVFAEEGMVLRPAETLQRQTDSDPRYEYQVGGQVGECFAGNEFDAPVLAYTVHYWPEDECDESFLSFVGDTEVFRLFVQDWFMAVGEELRLDISTDAPPLRLNDDMLYNYLNYNTNI